MLNNLAVKLRLRHAMDASRPDDLRAAVDLGRAATAADHPDHVLFEANLGLALFDRYRITGASSLLSEAVAAQLDAVAQSPPGLVRGRYRSAAAAVLHALYRRSGRTEVLDQSVEQARGAVADLPVTHPLRARAWADLGVSLRSAYRETRDPRLLAEAVVALRQAVQDAQGTVEEALYLSNLAATMLPASAGEAAGYARRAVDLLPENHSELPYALANLARVLLAGAPAPATIGEARDAAARAAMLEPAPPYVGSARPGSGGGRRSEPATPLTRWWRTSSRSGSAPRWQRRIWIATTASSASGS